MKNNVLYIVGGLILVGGGAYFYMKNKNSKSLTSTNSDATDGSGNTTPPNGTPPPPPPTPALPNSSGAITYDKPTTEISPSSLSSLQAVVYLNKYSDLNVLGKNLQKVKDHWVNYGKAEKRTIPLISNSVANPTELNDNQALIYLAKYPDLFANYGADIQRAKEHWINAGKSEKRTIDIVL